MDGSVRTPDTSDEKAIKDAITRILTGLSQKNSGNARELHSILFTSNQTEQILHALRADCLKNDMSEKFSHFLDSALGNFLPSHEASPALLSVLRYLIIHENSCANTKKAMGILQRCGKHHKLASHPQFVILEAYTLFCDGNAGEANERLRAYLQLHPFHLGVLLMDAQICISVGNVKTALDRYRTILQHYTHPPREVFVGLALGHYTTDNIETALQCVTRALECTPPASPIDDIELHIFRIILRAMNSRGIPAGESFEAILKAIEPLGVEEWISSYLITWTVCEATMNTLSSAEAVGFLRKMKQHVGKVDTRSAAYVSYTLARTLARCGEYTEALEKYRESYLKYDDGDHAHPSLIGYLLGSHLLSQNIHNTPSIESILEKSGNLIAQKQFCYCLLNRETQAASEYIEKLTNTRDGGRDPECWAIRSIAERGHPLNAQQSMSRARSLLDERNGNAYDRIVCAVNRHALAVACHDDSEARQLELLLSEDECTTDSLFHAVVLHNSAIRKYHQAKYHEAAELFRQAVSLGGIFDSLLWLACCAYKNMEYSKSECIAQVILQLQPSSLDILLLMNLLGVEHSIPRDPLDRNTQSLLRTQEGNTLFSAVLANISAGCPIDMNCVKSALQCYHEALTITPNNLIAHHNTAVVLECIGAHEDAKVLFDSIVALNVGNELRLNAVVNLGDIYLGQQKALVASRYFDRACGMIQSDADADDAWYITGRLADAQLKTTGINRSLETLQKCETDQVGTTNAQSAAVASMALCIMELIDGIHSSTEINDVSQHLSQADVFLASLSSIKSQEWENMPKELQAQISECLDIIQSVKCVLCKD